MKSLSNQKTVLNPLSFTFFSLIASIASLPIAQAGGDAPGDLETDAMEVGVQDGAQPRQAVLELAKKMGDEALMHQARMGLGNAGTKAQLSYPMTFGTVQLQFKEDKLAEASKKEVSPRTGNTRFELNGRVEGSKLADNHAGLAGVLSKNLGLANLLAIEMTAQKCRSETALVDPRIEKFVRIPTGPTRASKADNGHYLNFGVKYEILCPKVFGKMGPINENIDIATNLRAAMYADSDLQFSFPVPAGLTFSATSQWQEKASRGRRDRSLGHNTPYDRGLGMTLVLDRAAQNWLKHIKREVQKRASNTYYNVQLRGRDFENTIALAILGPNAKALLGTGLENMFGESAHISDMTQSLGGRVVDDILTQKFQNDELLLTINIQHDANGTQVLRTVASPEGGVDWILDDANPAGRGPVVLLPPAAVR